MKSCKPNSRIDASRDRNGESNVVALWRRTRKGEILTVWGEGRGGYGVNGSDYYEIRVGSDGVIYCSCPDYRMRGFKSNRERGGNYICKHVAAFLAHVVQMVNTGTAQDSECVMYKPEVALKYATAFAGAIAAGSKVASRAAA